MSSSDMPERAGPKYTPEEARCRIPIVAKRVARDAADLVVLLAAADLDSHEVERLVWALSGQVGYLNRLCHVVWRYEGLKRGAEDLAR